MAQAPFELLPAVNKMRRGLPNERVLLKDLPIGPLETYGLFITQDDVERWADLHDDPGLLAGLETGTAPGSILYYPTQSMLGREIAGEGGGGFSRYTLDMLAPVPVGKTIVVQGAITEKFVRRGWGYLRWQCEALVDGTVIQKQDKSWAFFPGENHGLPERPSDPRPPETEPLEVLPAHSLNVTPEKTRSFEGEGEHNGHTDFELGRQDPPGLLAQGEFSFSMLYKTMRDRFGAGFEVGGTLDLRFIKSVFTTEMVTAHGEVLSSNGTALVRLWAENGAGEIVTVGTGTARV